MDKSLITTTNIELTYGRGYAYSLQYHMVWCTKFRRPIIIGAIEIDLRTYLKSLAEEYNFHILDMEITPDYVHLFINCKPQFELSKMIKILKGNTARWLLLAHPEIKAGLHDGHLWAPSYCALTANEHSFEYINAYIGSQE